MDFETPYLGGAQTFAVVPGDLPKQRRAGKIGWAAGGATTIAQGELAMAIDGVAYPAMSGTALAGKLVQLTSYLGDGTNGVAYRSIGRQRVKIQYLAGTSKTLGLGGVLQGVGITALTLQIQLGTDGGGLVTSTLADVANFVNRDAACAFYGVKAAAYGTTSTLAALTAATAIAKVGLLGWAQATYTNASTSANADLEQVFYLGTKTVAGSSLARADVPGVGCVVNATTVSALYTSELDLPIWVNDVPGTNLAEVVVS